jgi:hypothetical protein
MKKRRFKRRFTSKEFYQSQKISQSMVLSKQRKRYHLMSKIHQENIMLLERIQNQRSDYSFESMKAKRKKERKYMK